MGKTTGKIILNQFQLQQMIRSQLPNSRIHSDTGRMNISIMLIGVTMAMGSAKLCMNRLNPFCFHPEYSIRKMLMIASPAVTFKSFVGGLKPEDQLS